MTKAQLISLAVVALGVVLAVVGALFARKQKAVLHAQPDNKKARRGKKLCTALGVFGSWLAIIQLLPLLFEMPEKEGFHVALFAPRVEVLGISISSTVIVTWIAMAVVLVLAVLVRLLVIPRMQEKPQGIQNILEIAVDGVYSYTREKGGDLGEALGAYLFSAAVLMIVSAAVELLGVRAPTADITMTFSLALITFFLINYYGIRQKGVLGRIKSLADPTPVVLPLRMISDIAIPVSMSCRLFGNMLGGMIVMELLYSALGSGAVGIPSVVGLYFNVFHPLIQAFIFVTLTLTFINEAAE